MAVKVALFARASDPLARHLQERLDARSVETRILELGKLAQGEPLAFDGEEWLFEGQALSELDAFFTRQIPAETALLGAPEETFTASRWFERAQRSREFAHLAQSCLADLEAAGKRVINPTACAPFDEKPLQLATFRRAGLPIPRTLITNLPAAVLAFEQDVGPLIYKPVGGGAETQLLDDAARARLELLATAPVIFQERIVGPDIRVTLVGGRVVSSVEIPSTTLDYRSGQRYQEGQQEYRPHPLPHETEQLCLRAAALCHQLVSGVDLKLSANGYVLIEANSGPVYLDIERKTGDAITEAIADLLTAR